MDKLRTLSGFNADDLLNKSGLLLKHEYIKKIDEDLLFEKSKELIRYELPDIDLKYARSVLDEAIKNYQKFEEIGGKRSAFIVQEKWIAPRLHNALRLTRYEAGLADVWNYLAIYFSDYIRHRWISSNKDSIAEYLFRYVTKDRHQLAKLWWMAELTRNGSEYHEHGGVLSADFIQQLLGVEDSRFQLTNLAIIDMQDDIFEDGLYQANDNWNRAIMISIRKKVAPQPITSKVNTVLDLKEYRRWLKDSPKLKDSKYGSKIPKASNDFHYTAKEINLVKSWIRESIKRVDESTWSLIRLTVEEILSKQGEKMQAKDIYIKGLESGKFFAYWQQEQIPFACAVDTKKFEVNGQTISLKS